MPPGRPLEETITVVGKRRHSWTSLDETFLVNLSNPANATILDGQGQGTITDDDAVHQRSRSTT